MKTTKDILKETLGSLNFPDAAWDELAEKIDNNNKVDTPDDIKDFVGKAKYDNHGQMIFRQVQDDGSVQMFLDVRGWGAIQHMGFKTMDEAGEFQDRVGQWVTDVINNNLK